MKKGAPWRKNAFVMVGLLALQLPVTGQSVDEKKVLHVKAAYLYSFIKFVSWPDTKFKNTSSPIVLGIMGEDKESMTQIIDRQAKGRGLIQGRSIQVIPLSYVLPTLSHKEPHDLERDLFEEQLRKCHLLFVDKGNKKSQKDILNIIKEHGVLSVGGGDGFVRGGGMVALIRRGESIVFQVNVDTVNRANLKISRKLLRSAELIR